MERSRSAWTVTSPSLLTLATGTATYADGIITFSADSPLAGQVWTKLDLPVNYTDAHGAATQVTQTGASVTFTDETGAQTSAVWIDPTQLLLNGDYDGDGRQLRGTLDVVRRSASWFENTALNGTGGLWEPIRAR